MDLIKKLHTDDNHILVAFGESRIGGRAENQDSFDAKQTERGFVVTVCDGMGGGPGGKTASTIAVREIIAGIEEAPKDEETKNVIVKAIGRANRVIIEAGNKDQELRGMGSTATVLLITGQSAFAAHVGDSRIYQFRGGKKVFRTFDHSLVFERVKQGIITEEQARLAVDSNIITRALGIDSDVQVDIEELPFEKGDRFILCSDGIHGTMDEKTFIKLATNRKSPLGVVVDNIATIVDNNGNNNGGKHDNLTLAIVDMKVNSKMKVPMSKQIKLILTALAAIGAISIILNIVQFTMASSAATDAEKAMTDSIAKWKVEKTNLNKEILKLEGLLKDRPATTEEN